MKATASTLPICLLAAMALGFAVLSHGIPAESQAATGPSGIAAPAEPEVRAALQPNVWVEAIFVELDRGLTPNLEKHLGFKLGPPDGKAILTAEEKEKLLDLVEKAKGATIISSLSALTVSGQQTQSEDVEEIIFPTEYDTETVNVSGGGSPLPPGEVFMVTPGNWEKRDVGTVLNVTPTITEDGKIALVLMPEVTLLTGWTNYGSDRYPIMQPLFRTWNKTTIVVIPDGSTFVLKECPITPLRPRKPEVPAVRAREKQPKEGVRLPPPVPEGKMEALRRELEEAVVDLERVRRELLLDSEGHLVQKQDLAHWRRAMEDTRAKIAAHVVDIERWSAMTKDEQVNAIQGNPAISQLAVQLAIEESQLNQFRTQYGEGHPEVVGQKQKIEATRKIVHKLADGVLASKKAELAALEAYQRNFEDTIARLKDEIARSEGPYHEYLRDKLKLEMKKAILREMEASLIQEAQRPFVEKARPPRIEKPKPPRVEKPKLLPVEKPRLPGEPIREKPETIVPEAGSEGAETVKDAPGGSGVVRLKGSNVAHGREKRTLLATNALADVPPVRKLVAAGDQPPRKVVQAPPQKTLLTIVSVRIVAAE